MKRVLFYVLSFTWGITQSLIGLLVILALLPFQRVHVFHGRLYGVIGKGWGGFELGCFFLVCEECANNDYTRAHESGHGLQNIIWGPLMWFVVTIPSAIRYWYRELKYYRHGLTPYTDYDSMWFEGQATKWGKQYVLTDKW